MIGQDICVHPEKQVLNSEPNHQGVVSSRRVGLVGNSSSRGHWCQGSIRPGQPRYRPLEYPLSATGGQSEPSQTKETTVKQPNRGRTTVVKGRRCQDQLKEIQNVSRHPLDQRFFPLLMSSRSQLRKEQQTAWRGAAWQGYRSPAKGLPGTRPPLWTPSPN